MKLPLDLNSIEFKQCLLLAFPALALRRHEWTKIEQMPSLPLFSPEHTMHGFIVHDEAHANGSMHSRVLRTLLTQNLENLMPALHDAMMIALLKAMSETSLNSRGIRFS